MLYLVAAGQLKNVSASSSMPKDMLANELMKLKSIAGGQKNDHGIQIYQIHVQLILEWNAPFSGHLWDFLRTARCLHLRGY